MTATIAVRMPNDVYLQRLRLLGAWWRLGSSALNPDLHMEHVEDGAGRVCLPSRAGNTRKRVDTMTQAIASRDNATIDPGSAIDPSTMLAETVNAIWKMIEQAATAGALDPSREDGCALLARRELVQRGTCMLSAVIRGGVESGAFWPRCPAWAVHRLPFAIVAGGCAHWVLGLSQGPSLRACTAVKAA